MADTNIYMADSFFNDDRNARGGALCVSRVFLEDNMYFLVPLYHSNFH